MAAEIFQHFQVLDGGMGSMLTKMGFNISDDHLWSARVLVDNPDAVVEAHKHYQAGLENLQKCLNISWEQSRALLQRSVTLARRAIDEFVVKMAPNYQILVAGSIGSYGSMLHDKSEYSASFLKTTERDVIWKYHENQAIALVEANVDLLAFETIPALEEAEIIAQVMQSSKLKDTPFWISFYCKDENCTGAGENFGTALEVLSKFDNVKAIGINCTNPTYIDSLLKQDATGKLIVLYPNRYNIQNNFNFTDVLPKWISRGVKIVGGCCHVAPEHVKQIASFVRKI